MWENLLYIVLKNLKKFQLLLRFEKSFACPFSFTFTTYFFV
jgi:hypothetical protein